VLGLCFAIAMFHRPGTSIDTTWGGEGISGWAHPEFSSKIFRVCRNCNAVLAYPYGILWVS